MSPVSKGTMAAKATSKPAPSKADEAASLGAKDEEIEQLNIELAENRRLLEYYRERANNSDKEWEDIMQFVDKMRYINYLASLEILSWSLA